MNDIKMDLTETVVKWRSLAKAMGRPVASFMTKAMNCLRLHSKPMEIIVNFKIRRLFGIINSGLSFTNYAFKIQSDLPPTPVLKSGIRNR
jgi:hypothetical protein